MGSRIFRLYDRTVLSYPLLTLLFVLAMIIIAGLRLDQFRLDASPDSLVKEGDKAFQYYQTIQRRFNTSEDFLVVSYRPDGALFTQSSIGHLRAMRDELAAIEGIKETNSILNVPLLHSPKISLTTVGQYMLTLDEDEVPLDEAKTSLLDNPLYPNLLISEDGTTTAVQLVLPADRQYQKLRDRRAELREIRREEGLNEEQAEELETISAQYRERKDALSKRQDAVITEVRDVLRQYQDRADIHLGGLPMIVADMIAFVESDLVTFGLGVLAFILITLTVIFRQPRWILLPLICCATTVWLTLGYLGWTHWPVTVISSNFVSLLLIITLSLTVHLIVRHREYQQLEPEADRYWLVSETVRAMGQPCFYMVLTTIVAFGSLFFSQIQPVIDFGLMMTVGIAIAYLVVFLVLPAILMLLPRAPHPGERLQKTPIPAYFGRFTDRHGNKILAFSVLMTAFCIAGAAQLSVENRFIDYFKSDTEIHQGMLVIDKKLGGTTPLDVIISLKDPQNAEEQSNCDPFVDPDCGESEPPIRSFFSSSGVNLLKDVHDYLDQQPETGKVISLATTVRLAEEINQGQLSPLQLGLMGRAFPENLRDILLTPYVNQDTRQARISVRLIESMPDSRRNELFQDINQHLTGETGLDNEQVQLTGMALLYNNMLQSLFESQIKTLGVVFLAIMAMFMVLFRSLKIALIAAFPNLLAAGTVLGIMGWAGISLDMMTITVAAISVGIAVDNTIHYIYRFRQEFPRDRNYREAMHRSHRTIGRAMFYTSLTIIIGFSILALSNFIPTIYFGIFTGLAMGIALLGALTLLPQLLVFFRPLGPGHDEEESKGKA